ncbi:MAG: Ig-like domain-containing protein, partial [Porphyromonadaceae bacterium]|nr:Ig-like domain-containing protein [Porphyromonadaceae bacterium]
MKKQHVWLALALMLVLMLGCEKKELHREPEHTEQIKIKEINLDKEELKLEVGTSLKLTATVTPKGSKEVELVWSSNADKVASVSLKGEVKALAEGEAIILVHPKGMADIQASCRIMVEKKAEGPGNDADKPKEEPEQPGNDADKPK